MRDRTTGLPLQVLPDVAAGPYIRVSLNDLQAVREVLDRHKIRYSVSENAVSLSGGPLVAVVNLGIRANASAIQAILDGAS